jgi:hypothetical protein
MIYVLKIIWDYRGAAIGTYRPQYHPLSAVRYLDANLLPTRITLFNTSLEADPHAEEFLVEQLRAIGHIDSHYGLV